MYLPKPVMPMPSPWSGMDPIPSDDLLDDLWRYVRGAGFKGVAFAAAYCASVWAFVHPLKAGGAVASLVGAAARGVSALWPRRRARARAAAADKKGPAAAPCKAGVSKRRRPPSAGSKPRRRRAGAGKRGRRPAAAKKQAAA